jgi:hypothetical protein
MTLVLSCLTDDIVYQVSDRRLTSFVRPDHVYDDERNKAVVVNGRVTFGYTGLAEIGNMRSDDWLARVIADGPSNDMAQVACRIKERATLVFRQLNLPVQFKRQAFQGVGWFRLKGEDWYSPGIVTIDNAIDHQTGSWLTHPLPEFQVTTRFPSKLPGGFILDSIGITPSAEEKNAVFRLAHKCVKHRRSTPRTIVHSLIVALRWLSSRHAQIGLGLMVVVLPKRSVERSEESGHMFMVAGAPNEFTPSFVYVSATGLTTQIGPHFVSGGGIMPGFEGGSLPRPGEGAG